MTDPTKRSGAYSLKTIRTTRRTDRPQRSARPRQLNSGLNAAIHIPPFANKTPPPSSLHLECNEQFSLPVLRPVADFQHWRVLLVAPLEEALQRAEQLVAEQLRMLVKEVVPVKAHAGYPHMLSRWSPDMLLVLGCPDALTEEENRSLQASSAKKAVWLPEGAAAATAAQRQTLEMFDFQFTPPGVRCPGVPFYSRQRIVPLPYAADTELFRPRNADADCRCDWLVLDEACLLAGAEASILAQLLDGRNVAAWGNGWEAFPSVRIVGSEQELKEYYHGADIVIHGPNASYRRMFEAAACGAVQLASADPQLKRWFAPGDDLLEYANLAELAETACRCHADPELRRRLASRALWRSKYDNSFFHRVMELLLAVAQA